MSLLRAATTTRIDESQSPANITALKGETALLVCTVLNVGDKSVRSQFYYLVTRVELSHWSRSIEILCSDWLNLTMLGPGPKVYICHNNTPQ